MVTFTSIRHASHNSQVKKKKKNKNHKYRARLYVYMCMTLSGQPKSPHCISGANHHADLESDDPTAQTTTRLQNEQRENKRSETQVFH